MAAASRELHDDLKTWVLASNRLLSDMKSF